MSHPLDYDVIIAGAGPAGSQAAITLSRAGRKVLVLEKKTFPRSKPCGGCLSKRVERFLPRPFLDEVVEGTINRVVFHFYPNEKWEYASDQPAAYMVRRERFDLLLAREAAQAGAEIRFQTPLTSFQEDADSIEAFTPGQSFRARFLILAQGAYDTLPPSQRSSRSSLTYQALEGRLKDSDQIRPWPPDTVAIHLGSVAFGYGWIFPCGDSLSVGLSFWPKKEKDPQSGIRKFRKVSPGLQDRPRLKGHPIPCFDGRPRAYSRGRVLWVGDAARLVDPFLGEGIYYALWSGQLGAQTIHQALGKGRPELDGLRSGPGPNPVAGIPLCLAIGPLGLYLAPTFLVAFEKTSRYYGYLFQNLARAGKLWRLFPGIAEKSAALHRTPMDYRGTTAKCPFLGCLLVGSFG